MDIGVVTGIRVDEVITGRVMRRKSPEKGSASLPKKKQASMIISLTVWLSMLRRYEDGTLFAEEGFIELSENVQFARMNVSK